MLYINVTQDIILKSGQELTLENVQDGDYGLVFHMHVIVVSSLFIKTNLVFTVYIYIGSANNINVMQKSCRNPDCTKSVIVLDMQN